ncbi:MAG: AmmeMemoRadiSam system protein A [Candidatus Woesearchaeota archaeon]
MLTREQTKKLLRLARNSIETYFSKTDIDLDEYSEFDRKQGVFVTLHKDGDLRGCIGFPYPTKILKDAVFEAARAAAFEDPRFPELEEDELKEIDIEISVLTPLEELDCDADECIARINIGEDGLILQSPLTSGLLLPQVFTEYDCTPSKALEMTCKKAGLPVHAWKDSSVKIFKFQAQIFREKE